MDTKHDGFEKPKCRYGSKCFRMNPQHVQKYSHPPKSETNEDGEMEVAFKTSLSIRKNGKTITKTSRVSFKDNKKPDALVHIPTEVLTGAVVGKRLANVAIIKNLTGARSMIAGNKISLFGSPKQVAQATDCWHKLIAIAPMQRNVEKIYPKTTACVQFFPVPDGIRLLQKYQDPQILMVVGDQSVEDAEAEITLSNQLQRLMTYTGKVKLHAKFGKNIWYEVPDSLQDSRPADQMFKAIRELPVKSFFSMGVADEKALMDTLEYRKSKETFNIKVLMHNGGLFEGILISVLVKDGVLRFAKAQMQEEKHIIDQICLDKDVDIRLSLENTKLLTPESPHHAGVIQFVQALQLKKDGSGKNTVMLPNNMPHIQVYRIQHKIRNNYIFDEHFNIDIISVRIFECEDKLLESNYVPPADVPFVEIPTEVEVSCQKWKRMFKFNKPNPHTLHSSWKVEDIMAGFQPFITVVQDVASLLANASKKS